MSLPADTPEPVLLTGGTGFIGTHLGRRLNDRGHRVRALVRPGSLPRLDFRAETVLGDLADRDALRASLDGVGTVLHLAAAIYPPAPGDVWAANVEGMALLLEEAARARIRHFVFMSSLAAHQPKRGREGLYGQSKREAEKLVHETAATHGFTCVTLRPTAVYGPGMKGRMHSLFERVQKGKPIPLPRPAPRRSLAYVGNVVSAALAAMDHAGSGTYHVADAEALALDDFLEEVGRGAGRAPRLVRVPTAALRAVGRIGDLAPAIAPLTSDSIQGLIDPIVIDITAAREELGWDPPYSVAEGIRETTTWLCGDDERQ